MNDQLLMCSCKKHLGTTNIIITDHNYTAYNIEATIFSELSPFQTDDQLYFGEVETFDQCTQILMQERGYTLLWIDNS